MRIGSTFPCPDDIIECICPGWAQVQIPPGQSYSTNGRVIVYKAKRLIHNLGLSGLDHNLGPRVLLFLLWTQGLTNGSIHSVSVK